MMPEQSDPVTRADLESLLRARRLDRTLTSSLPPLDPHDEYAVGSSGVPGLDAMLGGGFPRGQLSEVVGPRSSGRISLITRLMAAATARHELVALVDVLDMFDVESAGQAGVDLTQLLWIRGQVTAYPGLARDRNERPMEQAIRALALVLGAGSFGLVVFDAGEAPVDPLRRLPFTTWLRLQRMIEGRQTICVLVAGQPMARSSAGLTVKLECGDAHRKFSCRFFSTGAGASAFARYPSGELRRTRRSLGGGGPPPARTIADASPPGSSLDPARDDPGPAEGSAWPQALHHLFDGLDLRVRVIRARARAHEDVCVSLSTTCA
jgi:hypothetical protein